MKILACASPNNTIGGFQRAAQASGHTWVWWEERKIPAFDVFDELHPGIIFVMSEHITQALNKCIQEFQTPTIIGYTKHPFRFTVQVGDRKSDKEFFTGLVDTDVFSPGDINPQLRCVFGVTSKPNPELLEICFDKQSVKILHEEPWPVAQYLGVGSIYHKRDLYRSCDFAIVDDLFEIGRAYACGTNVVHADDFSRETINECVKSMSQYESYREALSQILYEANQ